MCVWGGGGGGGGEGNGKIIHYVHACKAINECTKIANVSIIT